jgi:hypothetical protein
VAVIAEIAAELPTLPLDDALEVLALMAEQDTRECCARSPRSRRPATNLPIALLGPTGVVHARWRVLEQQP